MRTDLGRLISPKSVAILGGRWADLVADRCEEFGFQGPVYRVHPKRAAGGQEGYWPSLKALPTVPDCTFLGINRDATLEAVQELRELGAGGAICLASGFSERPGFDGVDYNSRLLKAAGGLPVLGPNCLGMVNFFDRVSLFPEPVVARSVERGVCVIAQSGTVACDVLFAKRHLPIGYVFSTGNQSSVTSIDIGYAALNDPRVTAIGMYLESVGDSAAFRDFACAARDKKVPIVMIKAGRSEVARSITLSHTGAMAGSEKYFDAFLQRLGVGRCDTLAEFVETLKLLHVHGPFSENRLAISAGSGGDMAIASDLLQGLDVQLPKVRAETRDELGKILGGHVAVGNPFDFQTGIWHDEPTLCQMFSAVQDGEADLYGFFVDHPTGESEAHIDKVPVRAFIAATRATGSKGFIASTLSESTPASIAELAIDSGVAPMQGMLETFRAFEVAAQIGSSWANFQPPRLAQRAYATAFRNVSEFDAKKMLSSAGIKTPKSIRVIGKDAPGAAEVIGYPVVMKISSELCQHKTEVSGVSLNIDTREKAIKEATRLGRITDEILVEEMIVDGVAEFIIGANVDTEFGPVVLIGAGGVLAELIEDSVVLLPPFSRDDVLSALKTLRSFRLLLGYRQRPIGDVEALISAVMSLAELAQDPTLGIVELEINPIIVRAQGLGAVAVDCLIRKNGEE
ncbi:acyl-CoA synthetase [Mesorhizobium tianshanense]|uniref:Acyl-CoA synthetase (NDP forming) n=1 Tax=Mesorhizobium tianshanense TaxID=39844 RepID=A0A562N435_9HYPH|nr:acetate--CoA ligase family protein [Mesorhizobium tianshanense]TWI26850.1 acyl-CoA synthetase (NDP forming) [Mesorhizobium tianshanense]GLS40312.1 acyl-CoA synthetase [Mesorhizobium tianshanense]